MTEHFVAKLRSSLRKTSHVSDIELEIYFDRYGDREIHDYVKAHCKHCQKCRSRRDERARSERLLLALRTDGAPSFMLIMRAIRQDAKRDQSGREQVIPLRKVGGGSSAPDDQDR